MAQLWSWGCSLITADPSSTSIGLSMASSPGAVQSVCECEPGALLPCTCITPVLLWEASNFCVLSHVPPAPAGSTMSEAPGMCCFTLTAIGVMFKLSTKLLIPSRKKKNLMLMNRAQSPGKFPRQERPLGILGLICVGYTLVV